MSPDKKKEKTELTFSTDDPELGILGPLEAMFGKFEEIELEKMTIDVDELEVTVPPGGGTGMSGPARQFIAQNALAVQQFTQQILAALGVQMQLPTGQAAVSTPGISTPVRPTQLLKARFKAPLTEYSGEIREITLGASKGKGGSRSKTITVGGHKAPAWNLFQAPPKHPPVVAADVFDMRIKLAKAVRMHYDDVMDDPVDWARLVVNKFGADFITYHMISTDPLLEDTSAKEAMKGFENLLQNVKVPIIVGGSGDPAKDAELLALAAEVAEGERVLLASATVDMWEPVAKAAKAHDQLVLSWTSIDINQQKELNRRLLDYVSPDQIIIDPTTAALGYGAEYSFTIMQRMRLAGLMGDSELQFPLSSGTTNAWAAREAWMKKPELGPRELRGPIWESTTALMFLLAGVDVFMMMHPAAIKTVHDLISWLSTRIDRKHEDFVDWTKLSLPSN
ncbi:MAG: CO dehydrogenase/acetyl-CoA synthase subunit delta [Candidatus Hermodarchaeia archaeon]|jgi:acetyl-CoA decarbonylase/synthase complex subunit delta